ncbi:MAG: class I SAM-dependent methyltransferase, partial [Burkholderiaceae bacterium]
MTGTPNDRTATVNGQWWGARSRDWADIQEGQCRPVYEAAFARLGLTPGMRYLDAGCGAGMAACLASDAGAVVTGLDASPALIEVARQRLPAGTFEVGELEELPFDDDRFDVVTGFNSFQYAGNPIVALREARRVTRPGGRVLVMTWGEPEGMPAAALVAALRPLLPPPPPGAP